MKLKLTNTSTGKTAEVEVERNEDTVETLVILASAEFEVDNTELLTLTIGKTQQRVFTGSAVGGTTSQQQAGVQLSTLASLGENDVIQVSVGGVPQANNTASSADQELLRLFGSNNNNNRSAPVVPQQQQQSAATTTNTSSSSGTAPAASDQALLNLFAQGLQRQSQQQQQGQGGAGSSSMMQRQDSQDPDIQKRIYEEIQRKNIEENLTNALEYTPEAFARVTMLYVPSEVNGHKMAAFIDSGAQMSVMGYKTAEKCGLSRLIDKKWGGTAVGVGQTKIVGRVHMAMVKIAGQFLPMSISVLEAENMEFLVGLDQLKRHQMMIDLKNNGLRVDENNAVKFLSEHELPKDLKDGIPPHKQPSEGEQGLAVGQDAAAAASTTVPNTTSATTTTNTANSTTTTSNLAPQRRPSSDQPASSSSSSLSPDQQEKVKNLKEMFGVNDAVAIQTLQASDWNPELAANMILSMVTE